MNINMISLKITLKKVAFVIKANQKFKKEKLNEKKILL